MAEKTKLAPKKGAAKKRMGKKASAQAKGSAEKKTLTPKAAPKRKISAAAKGKKVARKKTAKGTTVERKAARMAKKESQPALRMTDAQRMRLSGAEMSGYHAPTTQDVKDLTKDHKTSSQEGAINADEFLREGGLRKLSKKEIRPAKEKGRKAKAQEELFGSNLLASSEEEDAVESGYPVPPTSGGQIFEEKKAFRGRRIA